MRWIRLLAAWLPVQFLSRSAGFMLLLGSAAAVIFTMTALPGNALSLSPAWVPHRQLADELFQTNIHFSIRYFGRPWKLFQVPQQPNSLKLLSCARRVVAYATYRLALRETAIVFSRAGLRSFY